MAVPTGLIRSFDRLVVSRTFGIGYPAGRVAIEALSCLDPLPGDVEVRKGSVDGRPALLVVPAGADERPQVVWLHGGAFCFNSPRTYATTIAHVAKAIGAAVLAPSYRLAPENPYPAGYDDTVSALRAVNAEDRPVIVAGDSAGAGLALSASIALRDRGEPAPAGMLFMSPWVDLTLSGESIRANDGRDAILRAKYLPRHASAYAGPIDLADPRISPINADLAGLPPALIQCGSDELFLSEDRELAARLEAAGNRVDLQVYEGMWHDFQAHAGMLAEAARAVERMGEWARQLLA